MTVFDAAQQERLRGRYARIADQLTGLYEKVTDPQSRMASAAALLHAKMPHFFWVGFYRLVDGDLLVGPYQGPLACMLLERGKGVCWACVEAGEALLVPDVRTFASHIACDARALSEVVVPTFDASGRLMAVMDVDSDKVDAFSDVDVQGLQAIAALIYAEASLGA